ncbi:MFS transporter [Vibrio lamellibrachiae]|uniref:MFS transporter n=1 Tax=Vibrio lamellibrachiae TaxID=2910253 RepID=UPI003D10127C
MINKKNKQIKIAMTFCTLAIVFFSWGVLMSINTIVSPFLQQVFALSDTESMYIQLVFFSSPLIICLPASKLLRQVGYKKSLIIGLTLVAIGSFSIFPSTSLNSYFAVLISIFIIALGVAVLQVIANPFVAQLGTEQHSSQRLTFVSGVNSLGTTLGPLFLSYMLFAPSGGDSLISASQLQLPYFVIGLVMTPLILILLSGVTLDPAISNSCNGVGIPAWRHRHLIFGMVAIFFYTGAEVSIGSFLLQYLNSPSLGGYDLDIAGKYVSLYWGGAMVGRLLGSLAFTHFSARHILIGCTLSAICLLCYVIHSNSSSAAYALILVGLCNSVMYPVIFSLAISKLGSATATGSSLLVMSGIGGAIIPILQAQTIGIYSLQLSFYVPALSYVIILLFGMIGWRPRVISLAGLHKSRVT